MIEHQALTARFQRDGAVLRPQHRPARAESTHPCQKAHGRGPLRRRLPVIRYARGRPLGGEDVGLAVRTRVPMPGDRPEVIEQPPWSSARSPQQAVVIEGVLPVVLTVLQQSAVGQRQVRDRGGIEMAVTAALHGADRQISLLRRTPAAQHHLGSLGDGRSRPRRVGRHRVIGPPVGIEPAQRLHETGSLVRRQGGNRPEMAVCGILVAAVAEHRGALLEDRQDCGVAHIPGIAVADHAPGGGHHLPEVLEVGAMVGQMVGILALSQDVDHREYRVEPVRLVAGGILRGEPVVTAVEGLHGPRAPLRRVRMIGQRSGSAQDAAGHGHGDVVRPAAQPGIGMASAALMGIEHLVVGRPCQGGVRVPP